MTYPAKNSHKITNLIIGIVLAFTLSPVFTKAQDTSKSLLDFNNNKLIKKVNSFLDSNQKRINKAIYNKADSLRGKLNNVVRKGLPAEVEKPLPYEKLLDKKYTLGRRAFQNTVAQFNFFFYAEEDLKEIINKARAEFQEDYTSILPFYDFDLSNVSKNSIDSIIYRCNANIVFHDLRNNWVDDSYLLMAKAYLYHKDFDTAGSILQFINYSFDQKDNGADLPIGSNLRSNKGEFSIATKENNRIWENQNIRNESMIWQARNYFETGEINEGISLLQLLKSDASFPKRLYPFLYEQLAYGYYLLDMADNAVNNLILALPNAIDENAKSRWYYLIAQLYEQKNNTSAALKWYQKASQSASNPILAVYAKINVTQIESNNANIKWEELAANLERMTKRDKYKPYSDIIYFAMAKLAIQHKAFDQANIWLIQSIKKSHNSLRQKQIAFELLGEINYNSSQYRLASLAYDSLNGILKTNPHFEKIALRKKWLSTISSNDQLLQKEDSLQHIYFLPTELQKEALGHYEKNIVRKDQLFNDLFIDKIEKAPDYSALNNNIPKEPFNNNVNSFYFENKSTVAQGKTSFTQKWGERPNVDHWRRKSSGSIAYGNKPTAQLIEDLKDKTALLKDTSTSSTTNTPTITGIQNEQDFQRSKLEWSKNALANAQLFLLNLNDFEKAFPLYQKIISLHIDPQITERAYLDLASQYIHAGNSKLSDSIIQIVTSEFPNGSYIQKKNDALRKQKRNQSTIDDYKEAYFLTQIGNWDSLSQLNNSLNVSLYRTKWYTPFQFLKVKMYAQQRNDSAAIKILDSLILLNQNESIRERAKNIITQLMKRKETEAYLSNLVIVLPQKVKEVYLDSTVNATKKSTLSNDSTNALVNGGKTIINAPAEIVIPFTNDSLDFHYIALATNNVKEVFIKEAQNALNGVNADEFKKQKLNVTYVQFDDQTYIVWVGPFDQQKEATNYAQKIRPRLKEELLSFISPKQYDFLLISKSNIFLIKNKSDLKAYQNYMIKNIYK